MLTVLQYIVGIVLLLVCILLLQKRDVTQARRFVPVLATAAVFLDTPILYVFDDFFRLLHYGSTTATLFIIPLFVCETKAGQTVAFTIVMLYIFLKGHIDFEKSVDVIYTYFVFFAVFIVIFQVLISDT